MLLLILGHQIADATKQGAWNNSVWADLEDMLLHVFLSDVLTTTKSARNLPPWTCLYMFIKFAGIDVIPTPTTRNQTPWAEMFPMLLQGFHGIFTADYIPTSPLLTREMKVPCGSGAIC